MRQPDSTIFHDSMRSIEVDPSRVPAVRDLISRRTGNFLAAIQQELVVEASGSHGMKAKNRVRVGLTAFETEHWPVGSTREKW
jgi:hypothetical protein